MASKTIELRNRVNRLQRKNAELVLLAEAVQSFTKATTVDRIINRFLVFCTQITGAREVFFLSNKEGSRWLAGEVFGSINCETYNFLIEKTRNHGVTVNESNRNWTAILMPGEGERFVILADLPLPEKSTEYIEIVSRVIDPFVLALREKEAAERLAKSERALRESEERWATILMSIGDGVIATDPSANITFMNYVAEAFTGWTIKEARGKPIREVLNVVNEITGKEAVNPVIQVLRKGSIEGLANHSVLIRHDKTRVPIDESAAEIIDKDGKITGVVLVFRDITERKKAEEALEQAQVKLQEHATNLELLVEQRTKQLKDAERLAAIGATAGMVGHDIRNPLQAIVSDIYLLKDYFINMPDRPNKGEVGKFGRNREKR